MPRVPGSDHVTLGVWLLGIPPGYYRDKYLKGDSGESGSVLTPTPRR